MNKKTIYQTIQVEKCPNYRLPISEIRKYLDDTEASGSTHIELCLDNLYGQISVEIYVTKERLETDEEFKIREDAMI